MEGVLVRSMMLMKIDSSSSLPTRCCCGGDYCCDMKEVALSHFDTGILGEISSAKMMMRMKVSDFLVADFDERLVKSQWMRDE